VAQGRQLWHRSETVRCPGVKRDLLSEAISLPEIDLLGHWSDSGSWEDHGNPTRGDRSINYVWQNGKQPAHAGFARSASKP
jgi:hypothetical protein